MMLLVASALSLLVIYAGVKLLIQIKKEMLGNLYRSAAWFFIIAGFFILACAGACCIAMCCRYGARMMHKETKMAGYRDHEMKDYHKEFKKMMKHHHEMSNAYLMNHQEETVKCCCEACKTDTVRKK